MSAGLEGRAPSRSVFWQVGSQVERFSHRSERPGILSERRAFLFE